MLLVLISLILMAAVLKVVIFTPSADKTLKTTTTTTTITTAAPTSIYGSKPKHKQPDKPIDDAKTKTADNTEKIAVIASASLQQSLASNVQTKSGSSHKKTAISDATSEQKSAVKTKPARSIKSATTTKKNSLSQQKEESPKTLTADHYKTKRKINKDSAKDKIATQKAQPDKSKISATKPTNAATPKAITAKTEKDTKPQVRVSSLNNSEAITSDSANDDTFSTLTKNPEPKTFSDEYVETAFDLFVGGNYFGFVMLKYNDDWVELFNPQEAIALLPAVRSRQEMLPLFSGRISTKKEIAELGSVTVDYNNFALQVVIAPEQAIKTRIDMDKIAKFEGSPTMLARFAANGNIDRSPEESNKRFSISNSSRLALNQHRLFTSGSYNSTNSEYELQTLQAETDIQMFDAPFTFAGGVLDVPGQMFASSISVIGTSIFSNRKLYSDDPLLQSNLLEVFVPTRSLVEVFKNDAQTGQVLFSRMLEFGHNQIDTSRFPRGSYPVEIVISVDGVERSRYIEQFYKYTEIMPRERLEINLTFGRFCKNFEEYDLSVRYGSIRSRINDYLEGYGSYYSIGDRLILSQGVKTVFEHEKLGQFTLDFTLSESNRRNILGYSSNLNWKLDKISGYLSFTKAFADPPILHKDLTILKFDERKTFNISLTRNLKLFNRSLGLSFKGRYLSGNQGDPFYRYGPIIRYTPYRDKNLTVSLFAQHNWTSGEDETLMRINLIYRFDSFIASSQYNEIERESQSSNNFQNSIQYNGNKESPGVLKNISAKAVYSTSKTEYTDPMVDNETNKVSSLAVNYRGNTFDIKTYANHSSPQQSNNFGGEAITTFVAGQDSGSSWAGSVPMGSSIIAISLTGISDKEKLISILINGGHKAYMKIGETVLIDAPVYKESEVELRDANPQNGRFIKIINPITRVTPYPGNIISRSFEIASVAIISGNLLQHDGTPVDSKFFETGYEPAYTDSEGGFIVEMPIRSSEKQIDFIANNQLCSFELTEIPKDTLVEVGNITCKLASEQEIKLARSIHEETRIYD